MYFLHQDGDNAMTVSHLKPSNVDFRTCIYACDDFMLYVNGEILLICKILLEF